MTELVSSPEEAVRYIFENVYVVKIKCLACTESKFIKYVPPLIQNGKLVIGEHSFPIKLIEVITVRWKNEYGRYESRYKVESRYFRQFLNDGALDELEKFSMWPVDRDEIEGK